jgi:hypothetical protein
MIAALEACTEIATTPTLLVHTEPKSRLQDSELWELLKKTEKKSELWELLKKNRNCGNLFRNYVNISKILRFGIVGTFEKNRNYGNISIF